MEEEVKNFIKVWVFAIISMSYCYYIATRIKSGVPRLLSVLPITTLFLLLPLLVSSVHFSLITAFFLTWLANFKLILFCFDKGPLFPLPLTLTRFICFTCFPIKVQQNPKSQNQFSKSVFATKVAIFSVLIHFYDYKHKLHPIVLLGLYFVYFYLNAETILTIFKVSVFISLGCDLEPQFNKPYLATSLQDFWGRRWNVMVPAILRPTVYAPMRRATERRMSSRWALFPGIMAAFIVSGVIHELLFFYMSREKPTWEVTLYFVLQGVCTAVEVAVKKTAVMQRWQMSPVVSRTVTVGFVFMTGVWLFAPQLIRSGVIERLSYETVMFVDFFKRKLLAVLGLSVEC